MPSPPTPPLADGPFVLAFSGDAFHCTGIEPPAIGVSVSVPATATHDADGVWIAHSIIVGQEQTFELRLARGGTVSAAQRLTGEETMSRHAYLERSN